METFESGISLLSVFIRSHLLIRFLQGFSSVRISGTVSSLDICNFVKCQLLLFVSHPIWSDERLCGFEGYTAHFTLLAERERESWIKLPSTQLSLSEIHIFLCSVSTICWRCWLLVSMQTLLREGSLHLLFFANLLKPVISR